MGNEDDLPERLQTALHLDGSTESVKGFYAGWADRYNSDTSDWHYAAPANAVDLLMGLTTEAGLQIDPTDRAIRIMDAGCGTGQLARLLKENGYTSIDGFDLSPEMVEVAAGLEIYGELTGDVDLNQPIPDIWKRKYDCTVCIGVFTPGHVPPESLQQLINLTRPGGVIIVSTRVAYYESEGYQSASDELEDQGKLRLLHSLKNATYTNDEKAHYWVYASL